VLSKFSSIFTLIRENQELRPKIFPIGYSALEFQTVTLRVVKAVQELADVITAAEEFLYMEEFKWIYLGSIRQFTPGFGIGCLGDVTLEAHPDGSGILALDMASHKRCEQLAEFFYNIGGEAGLIRDPKKVCNYSEGITAALPPTKASLQPGSFAKYKGFDKSTWLTIDKTVTKQDKLVRKALKKCSYCHNPAKEGESLKLCSRCKKVQYCGQDCQKNHWKEHKLECN